MREPSLDGSPDVYTPLMTERFGARICPSLRHVEPTVQRRSGTDRRIHGSAGWWSDGTPDLHGACRAGHVSKRQNLGPKFGMRLDRLDFQGWKRRSVQMYVASHELIIVLCGVSSDQEVGKNAARAQVAMFPAPFRVTSEGVACGSPHPLTSSQSIAIPVSSKNVFTNFSVRPGRRSVRRRPGRPR